MRRVLGLEALGAPLERSTVTVGKFFAVHRGHQALLRQTVAVARQQAAQSVVLTFDRHPMEVLRPGEALPLLTTLEERLELIAAQGIDVTVVARVDAAFLAQEPEEFIRRVLVEQLGAVAVLASEQFRFGRRARGNVELLRLLGPALGYRCLPVETVTERGERISSSWIAACISEGRVAAAAAMLGRPYAVAGEVVHGDQVGRRLGFPTANIAVDPARLLPGDGVYAVLLRRAAPAAAELPAVANLGVRPTRDGTRRVLEVHVPDWSGDLYDAGVAVAFLERLREERRFPDLEALRTQIAADVEAARAFFSRTPPDPAPAP